MASKVHRVRYYNPKPQLINCISFNKTNKHIAIARGDASIEIWDLNYAPYLIKFIPGVENGSVEALGWVEDRLLSTGLGGALVEWDLDRLCVKNTVLLTGYAAWCLDVNSLNTTVAVGTEQGYVNLYSVENNEIVYMKLFDKQEGRIMCCKFNGAGNILATGSVDSIRVWNVQTGQAISRMSVSRRGKETIVWCLAVLSDDILVSGDSHGRLTFWDGALGEQIESYSTHKADILSIVVSDDEKSLYCSGVDPVITNFIKVNDDKHTGGQWVKNVQRHIHEHDVRALALNGGKLLSAGIDGYLTLSSFPPKWVMRIPHMLPVTRSSVCAKKKLLLLRYSNHLEVWKLGSYITSEGNVILQKMDQETKTRKNKGNLEQDSRIDIINTASMALSRRKQTLQLGESPVKLVSIQTKGRKQLRCCDLSPSGEFIFYSTDTHIRMLKLETDEDQTNVSVSKMTINGLPTTCDRVSFTEDSRTMVVHCAESVNVLQVDPFAGATVIQSINIEKRNYNMRKDHAIKTNKYYDLTNGLTKNGYVVNLYAIEVGARDLKTISVLHLYLSVTTASGSTYLVLADTVGAIDVWIKGDKKFEHYITLPKYKCVPTAMTIDAKRDSLIVTYTDQKIVEYELLSKNFSEWLNSTLPPEWYSRNSAVVSVTAHAHRDALIFQDETSLWVIERKPSETQEPVAKRKSIGGSCNSALRIIPIKYLAGFHWLGIDEAVTLEILPENIVSQLPPIMMRK